MIDIDSIADLIYEHATTILDKAGFYFVSNDDTSTSEIVKQFTLHDTTHDVIPLCKVTSFISQFNHFISQAKKLPRTLTKLEVQGPHEVTETCFLNKKPHLHHVWYLIMTEPNS